MSHKASDPSDSIKRPLADLDNSGSNDEQSAKSIRTDNSKIPSENVFTPMRRLARSPTRTPAVTSKELDVPPALPPKMSSPKQNLQTSNTYGIPTKNSFAALTTITDDNPAITTENSQRKHKQVVYKCY